MKKKVGAGLLMLSLLVFISSSSAFARGEVVTEGLGAIIRNNVSGARTAAINDALSLAVEQRLGVKLTSSRISQNYTLVKYRIESETEGFIDSYKILDEKRYDHTYWVKLSVKFKEDVLRQANLDELRVVVVCGEGKSSGEQQAFYDVCRTALQSSLLKAGMRIIPAGKTTISFDSSPEQISRFGRKLRADLIILARPEVKLADKFGSYYSYKAEIESRVVKGYTGEFLATHRIGAEGKRSLDREEAADSALTNASVKTADYIVRQVVERAKRVFSRQLFVTNVESRWQVDLILKALSKMKEVKYVSLEQFNPKVAVFEVELGSRAKEKLAYYVEHLGIINLRVKRQSLGWIEAEVY